MGIFSKKQQKSSVRKEFLIKQDVPFEIREAFRSLKATLSVSIPKKENGEGIVIMMTSACPEDGKTTVAVNLALMFANSNAKIALVDADVRKGRVAKYFKEKATPGLTDYLSGQVEAEEICRKVEGIDNFSYFPCGTRTARPYELLESETMKNFLNKLKKEYDYILIDTPPVLLLSDALALIPETDGTVVVCRHQSTYVSDIAKTLHSLSFAKANILGLIVNDYKEYKKTKSRFDRYGKYHYYDTPETPLSSQ